MAKKRIPDKLQIWIEARKRFHLSHAQVQQTRELGMNPLQALATGALLAGSLLAQTAPQGDVEALAANAEKLETQNKWDEAAAAYRQARELAGSDAERRFLDRRLADTRRSHADG